MGQERHWMAPLERSSMENQGETDHSAKPLAPNVRLSSSFLISKSPNWLATFAVEFVA